MFIYALSIIIVCNRVLRVQPEPRQVWHPTLKFACTKTSCLTQILSYNHES